MIIVTKESLISGLFSIGFNVVDEILYKSVLDILLCDTESAEVFHFDQENNTFSENFMYHTIVLPQSYKLNEASLIKEIKPGQFQTIKPSDVLNVSPALITYLETINYNEIFSKKYKHYKECNMLDRFDELFSVKEVEIMRNTFDVDFESNPFSRM